MLSHSKTLFTIITEFIFQRVVEIRFGKSCVKNKRMRLSSSLRIVMLTIALDFIGSKILKIQRPIFSLI